MFCQPRTRAARRRRWKRSAAASALQLTAARWRPNASKASRNARTSSIDRTIAPGPRGRYGRRSRRPDAAALDGRARREYAPRMSEIQADIVAEGRRLLE